ncbi:hypothetical protein INS49_012126 [Diaporthe citri]|uniref:uncharacterized protein n=1 Tax=Diaporthe citri TaxID=83186 RepID=UPI001C8103E7|nr:uncharacterized protein INS49_012126 [Diaporthe citri]KAG6358608.1 hypothetical protein INS49_012126 [Diaporthe citri]
MFKKGALGPLLHSGLPSGGSGLAWIITNHDLNSMQNDIKKDADQQRTEETLWPKTTVQASAETIAQASNEIARYEVCLTKTKDYHTYSKKLASAKLDEVELAERKMVAAEKWAEKPEKKKVSFSNIFSFRT